jgi:hypothetical protein
VRHSTRGRAGARRGDPCPRPCSWRAGRAVSRYRTFCRRCQRGFLFDPHPQRPDPKICGRTVCYARENWGPEEWAGRARMARARLAAGRVLVRSGRDADGNVVMVVVDQQRPRRPGPRSDLPHGWYRPISHVADVHWSR